MDIDEREEGGAEAGPSGVHSASMVQTNGYHANQKEEEEERLLDDQEWPLFYPVELGGGEFGQPGITAGRPPSGELLHALRLNTDTDADRRLTSLARSCRPSPYAPHRRVRPPLGL